MFEEAQTERQAGKLNAARAAAAGCAQEECPTVVRKQCAAWLDELKAAIPSILVTAEDAAGRSVSDALLIIDGTTMATRLEGDAIALDPGEHEVRIVPNGAPPQTKQVALVQGQQRAVTFTVAAPPSPRRSTESVPSAASATATVEDDDWAGSYAVGSSGLLSGASLLDVPSLSGVFARDGGADGFLGLSASTRFTYEHFLLQTEVSVRVGSGQFDKELAWSPTLGLGGAVAVAKNVAFSPMARLSMFFFSGVTANLFAPVAEFPVTVFVGKNGYVEPFIDIGAVIAAAGGRAVGGFLFDVGYRLGVVF